MSILILSLNQEAPAPNELRPEGGPAAGARQRVPRAGRLLAAQHRRLLQGEAVQRLHQALQDYAYEVKVF